MMNNFAIYYDEMINSTHFNVWTVVLLVTLAVMITIGVLQYQICDFGNGPELQKVRGDSPFMIVTAISTFVFAITYVISERYNGLTVVRTMAAIALFAFCVYFAGKFAGWAKHGYLFDKEKKAKKRRARRNKRQ